MIVANKDKFGLGEIPKDAVNLASAELSTTREEFEGLLKKACGQKPKPSVKSSRT